MPYSTALGPTLTRIPAWFGGILVVFISLLFGEVTTYSLHQNNLADERSDVVNHLSTIRAELEGEISSTLYLTQGLIANVAIHPNLSTKEFNGLSEQLVRLGKHIRNIGLAPNNIIRYVYPLAGNEAALGLDYRKNPHQWEAVKRAMETKTTVVAGPVNLVQGGVGLIARTPIFTKSQHHAEGSSAYDTYWGQASIVIDMDSLLATADIEAPDQTLDILLRGKDGLGADGAVFYGNPRILEDDPVIQTVTLPSGSWQIAAIPNEGWQTGLRQLWWFRITTWITSAILGALVWMLLRERQHTHRMAMHDSLTQLPNRRFFEMMLEQNLQLCKRAQACFALLYLDLNKFKPINDTHGHKAGDHLLQEVAQRIRGCLRNSDVACRLGGDEFAIILPYTSSQKAVDVVVEKLLRAIDSPVLYGALTLQVQASIGSAIYPQDAEDLQTLIHIADDAMYAAKEENKRKEQA